MARSKNPAWMDHLPLVLLGIRTSVRQDLDWCPAELVYGATLRLPGEFLFPPGPDSSMLSPSTAFVARLRASLAAMRPAPASHHRPPSSSVPGVPPSLVDVFHVYLRVDAIKRPLCRPYEGPFRVLKKDAKTFVISRAGKAWTVSVDRLKPAWGFLGPPQDVPPSARLPPPSSVASGGSVAASARDSPDAISPALAPVLMCSGRVSRPPSRF